MLELFDCMLTTSNVEATKKIQRLFADFNIHGAMTIKEQYDVKLHKYFSVNVFLYSLRDISDCARKNEFLNELGYIMFTYDLSKPC